MKKPLFLLIVILGCGVFLKCGPGSKNGPLNSTFETNSPAQLASGDFNTGDIAAAGDTGNCKVIANITFQGGKEAQGKLINFRKTDRWSDRDSCDYSMTIQPPTYDENGDRRYADITLRLDKCDCTNPRWGSPASDESGENPQKGFMRVFRAGNKGYVYETTVSCDGHFLYKVCALISY